MVRPVLLAVDDEPAARSSIEKELRKRYGADHEVICEGSGAAALGVLGRVGATTEQLPVVVTFDGLGLRDPSFAEIAEALSAPTRPAAATYDVTVVGAGPARPRCTWPATPPRSPCWSAGRPWPRPCPTTWSAS
jgi:hypothetical protein